MCAFGSSNPPGLEEEEDMIGYLYALGLLHLFQVCLCFGIGMDCLAFLETSHTRRDQLRAQRGRLGRGAALRAARALDLRAAQAPKSSRFSFWSRPWGFELSMAHSS